MYHVEHPNRKTVFLFRATHESLSGAVPECVVAWNKQWLLFARLMSMTVGLANAINRVRSSDPRVHAVFDVKVGKARELSMILISSNSRGGMGMIGSVAMILVVCASPQVVSRVKDDIAWQ
jgi:hypothetical protein